MSSATLQFILFFIVAGLLEIGGGYLMWLWLLEKWAWWVGALGALIILRLCWTRCAVWTRRRNYCAVGNCGIVAVRAGDGAACARLLHTSS